MAGETLPVCPASALPPRTRRVIDHDRLKLVVLNCAGELFAIEDRCSHEDTPLADGELERGELLDRMPAPRVAL
jgi:3-phenylpropionate/trans-cinnamate dioxygenase ferredoxin subunit